MADLRDSLLRALMCGDCAYRPDSLCGGAAARPGAGPEVKGSK
jgi:hypothetical protein